jgi:phage baseplate assembly protein W
VAALQRIKRSQRQETAVIYQDLYLNNLFSIDTKDLVLIKNEDSIKQSIINIILTSQGERFFNPEFGSNVYNMLFENISPQTSTTLRKLILTAINNYEPRAEVQDIIVTPLEERNAYTVSILFNVINKSEPITLDLILNRVR